MTVMLSSRDCKERSINTTLIIAINVVFKDANKPLLNTLPFHNVKR